MQYIQLRNVRTSGSECATGCDVLVGGHNDANARLWTAFGHGREKLVILGIFAECYLIWQLLFFNCSIVQVQRKGILNKNGTRMIVKKASFMSVKINPLIRNH